MLDFGVLTAGGVGGVQIEPNDVLSVLAERFGTSIRHIQLNNWGLSEQLTVGQHICIIPNSCVTAEHVVRT